MGAAAVTRHQMDVTKKRATCRLCTMHCGTIATLRGDRLVKVEGDPESATRGFLCLNGHALPEIVHDPDRLATPLIRQNGALAPASWDEALRHVAGRLRDISERHGARALFVQTGWPFVRHPLVSLLQRFVHAFGSPNISTVASLCEASARMGRALTCGSNYLPDLERARTLVLWGANPAHAAPPFAHLVGGFGRSGGKNLVVIDPVRHELARAATMHLAVRPGTDGALALACIAVVIRDGLHDARFVAEETVGFAELSRLASDYPPERAAAICGVPAADIERAARLMATETPTAVWPGLGIEHHRNGVQAVRAVSCLEALIGALRDGAAQLKYRGDAVTPGEPLPQLYHLATAEPVPPMAPDAPVGHADYPLYGVYNRQAQGMLLPRAVLEDDPYPVRALILVGCNALVTFPDAALMRRVFDRLELIVTIDPFMSASARASHVVLPAATFAESAIIDNPRLAAGDRADKVDSGHVDYAGRASVEAVIEPRGDSRPDWRIVFDLARELGLGAYFPWESLHEALAAPMKRWLRDPSRELTSESGGAFATESGRVELASPTLGRFGYEALPVYVPPGEPTSPDYPLILVTGPRTRPYINSQLRSIPSVRRKMPEPSVRVHPRTAAALGLADGDTAEVTTALGQLTIRCELSDEVREDTVVIPHGWDVANANTLIDAKQRDPISGFPAFRYAICRVRKAG